MKVWVNTLIRNEERFVWFSIMSVIDCVDKVLVWDTGSDDCTVRIIKEIKKIYPKKLDFSEVGKVSVEDFPEIRQKMLEATRADWVMIVDGDEVWWEVSIKEIIEIINKKGNELDSIVNRYFNLVGDIFHYQSEDAGMYNIDGRKGHLNIRAMNRKIPGLHAAGIHGRQAYYDGKGTPIQERDSGKRVHIDSPSYLHFTHLRRSLGESASVPKRSFKLKYELGKRFPLDFYYPEVFFRPRPSVVPYPWEKMTFRFLARAMLQTPLKRLKRKILPSRSGY